uniref:Uncharacterized protein n=1 Tax=Populus trichocarpa TaxID=3694 RepID=A0A3N7F2R0_POPTR
MAICNFENSAPEQSLFKVLDYRCLRWCRLDL